MNLRNYEKYYVFFNNNGKPLSLSENNSNFVDAMENEFHRDKLNIYGKESRKQKEILRGFQI